MVQYPCSMVLVWFITGLRKQKLVWYSQAVTHTSTARHAVAILSESDATETFLRDMVVTTCAGIMFQSLCVGG